ncbi:MAG: LCP family protein [Firmicutes bacterium]|nr:LCP family protein [Bacillota bacterium]
MKRLINKIRQINIIPKSAGYLTALIVLLLAEALFLFLLLAIDLLPGSYLLLVALVMAALDFSVMVLMADKRGRRIRRTGLALLTAVVVLICAGSFYLFNTYSVLERMIAGAKAAAPGEPFNLYISGIDSRNGIEETARSDVNMIVTVNPQNREILLTSMPRDSYVNLHMNGELDKLTHTGIYGIDETIQTVEDWMGIEIDYYARVDFQMLVNLVNAIGGIDVYSDYAFKSAVTDWTYEKGWNHCTGKKALYFARERKAFKGKDQQRIKNQQIVLKAIFKKITSSKTLLLNYGDILKAVDGEMQTDMPMSMISELVRNQLETGDEWTIKRQTVKGKMDQKGTWSMGPNRPLDVCIINEESLNKCVDRINAMMAGDEK